MKAKTRSKTLEEANGGTCNGASSETEECNTHNCPGAQLFIRDHIFIIYCITISNNSLVVNCQWGDWNSGDCSKSCGLGQMTKTRVKARVEAHGGTCSGDTTSTEACNTNSCAGMRYSR